MKPEKEHTDENLVTDLLADDGDTDIKAYEQLFHKYYPMLRNFISGLLKSHAAADDIAQNCFMKLWFNRFSLRPGLSVKNYLFVLARNEAINVLRSSSSKAESLSSQHESELSLRMVDDWLNYSETNTFLKEKIDALPPQRRTIFKMSRYEHISNVEITMRLNLSVRTVEKHIELALRDLRKGMDHHKIN